jgi:hypothetical protein
MTHTQSPNRVVVIRGTAVARRTPKQRTTAQSLPAARRIVVIRDGVFVASRPSG